MNTSYILILFCSSSKEFSEYIRDESIADDEMMISLVVTSLYTNVPIKDTLIIVKDLLVNDPDLQTKTNIPAEDLLEITELLLTKTCFQFNGKFLKQTHGVAMGGPASSVIAEIYMQAHESTALTTTSNPPKVWERFVDDVFLIIKKSSLEGFFKHVNGLHDQNTNYQKTLAEYAFRLEKIQKTLIQLYKSLHDFKLVRKESKEEADEKQQELKMDHYLEYTRLLLDAHKEEKQREIDFITRQNNAPIQSRRYDKTMLRRTKACQNIPAGPAQHKQNNNTRTG